jgi:hypothetical protein
MLNDASKQLANHRRSYSTEDVFLSFSFFQTGSEFSFLAPISPVSCQKANFKSRLGSSIIEPDAHRNRRISEADEVALGSLIAVHGILAEGSEGRFGD